MTIQTAKIKDIPTQIKNKKLVVRRRRQIVDAAVQLFMENGFHKTTTRQIAQAAGISIGLLYEYITAKEDILFLVCEAIHTEMKAAVTQALTRTEPDTHPLASAISEYFLVCHRLSDHIILIYREIHSLPSNRRKVVFENEMKITGLFSQVLMELMETGKLPVMDAPTLDMEAHNIAVLGHMWALRRYLLARQYTIAEYIKIQSGIILNRFQI